MLRRRQLLMAADAGGLPAAYQAVDYIQTDGYAFIDTGIYADNDTGAKLDFQLLQAADSFFFGTRTTYNTGGYAFLLAGGNKYATAFDGSGNTNLKKDGENIPADTSRHLIFQNKNVAFFDGYESDAQKNDAFTTSTTLYICRSHHVNNGTLTLEMRVYSCIIYDNGIEVRNFVPCYRKSDNVVGMYDTVNSTFYVNANSRGDFSIPA